MKTFTISQDRNPETLNDLVQVDEAKTYTIDLTPWAQDNGDITAITWTIKAGTVTISDESLTANIASCLMTFTQSGNVRVQVKAQTSDDIHIINLGIAVKDRSRYADDYGL